MKPKLTITIADNEHTITMNEKKFKTGSRGFHGLAKIDLGGGLRYQGNFMLIEIGSKPEKK